MSKKGGNVIRIVLGVYLIYLGVNILLKLFRRIRLIQDLWEQPAVYLSLSERSMHFLRQKKCLRDEKREECRRRAFSFRSGWK